MPDLIITLPAVEQTVAVTRNGRTQSATSTPPAPNGLETAAVAHYLRPPTATFGDHSVTIESAGHGIRWASGFAPALATGKFVVTHVDGNRFDNGFIDNSDTLRPAYYIGSTATVWREVDGVWTLIRTSEVTGGNFGDWKRVISSSQIVTTTTAELRFDAWNRPGVAYHFGVAAVASGGAYGSIATTTYTPATVGTGDAASNTLTTQAVTSGGALAAPANFTATADGSGGGLVSLSWDAVSGAIGYVVFRSDYDPATHPTRPYLELADDGGADIAVGDVIWAKRRLMRADAATHNANRVYSDGPSNSRLDGSCASNRFNKDAGSEWYYEDFTSEDPAPDLTCGGSCGVLEIDADQAVADRLSVFWAARAVFTFYPTPMVGETYRWRCWVWADRAASVVHRFEGWTGQAQLDTTINLVAGWQEVTIDWPVVAAFPDAESNVKKWAFRAGTVGAAALKLRFGGLRMWRVGATYGQIEPDVLAAIPAGMWVRDHGGIKNRGQERTVEELTNLPGAANRGYTLAGFLMACRDGGARPWLQVPWDLTPAEHVALHAYIDAPVSSGHPMALKRAAQGQVEPWSSLWDEILWECDNEAWNTLSAFNTAPPYPVGPASGATFGRIFRGFALAMQDSPHWSGKIKWVIGGWARNSFGVDAARTFGLPVYVGIANYNGGWDEGTGLTQDNDLGYQSVLSSVAIPNGNGDAVDDLVTRLQSLAAEEGSPYTYGVNLHACIYEAGPGYQLNGLNGASVTADQSIRQERVMKSRAAATGTAEGFCRRAIAGLILDNFFTPREGDTWSGISKPSQGGQVYYPWQIMRILATAIPYPIQAGGASKISDAGITVETQAGGTATVDKVFAYHFRSGSKALFVIGNRSITETIKPAIRTAYTGARSCTVYPNVGDYREHNRYPEGLKPTDANTWVEDLLCVHDDITAQSVSVPSDLSRLVIDDALGATTDGIPPGCCVLVLLDGVM